MDWEKVGTEQPVKDDNGERPATDDNGRVREMESVPYIPIEYLEFVVDEMAKARDRRLLDAQVDSLGRQHQSSPAFAVDFEATLETVTSKFVRCVRDTLDDNREYKGPAEVSAFLSEELDYDDALALMYWLRRRSRLAQSKKKNSKRPSG
jgi:hypothetical protein